MVRYRYLKGTVYPVNIIDNTIIVARKYKATRNEVESIDG